jgi:hypothetical protein
MLHAQRSAAQRSIILVNIVVLLYLLLVLTCSPTGTSTRCSGRPSSTY